MERQVVERNLRYLVLELAWASINIAALSFNSAYLLRLGGSNLQVSLLSSGAALINALLAIPSAAFMEKQTVWRPWIIWSLFLSRILLVGILFVPLLEAHWQPITMLLLVLLFNVPGAFFNSGFLPVMADIIPPERRARLFSARSITLGIVVTISTLVMGYWLDHAPLPFPFNYQILYLVALVTGLIGWFYFARLTIPDKAAVVTDEHAPRPIERPRFQIAGIRNLFLEQRPYANLAFNTLLFNIPLWMGTPLQPIYFVRELGASDGWIGIWLGMINGGTIAGSWLWGRLIAKYGFNWSLQRAAIIGGFYYLLIAIFPNLTLIAIFALFWGLISPGVDIAHFNVLLEVCPPARRAIYIGVFSTIMNLAFFATPLAVAPLANWIGAQELVLALGVMRVLAGALFTLNPVRSPAPPASVTL